VRKIHEGLGIARRVKNGAVRIAGMFSGPTSIDTPPTPGAAMIAKTSKWDWLPWVGIVAGLSGVLIFFAPPEMVRSTEICGQLQAVCNARVIGLTLTEFETEYGSFPDEKTISQIKAIKPTDLQ
jgi:hypothetical protein